MTDGRHPDARFWDRIAGWYAKRPVDDPAAYETKLALTRERLTPDARVLEIGCGTGTTALIHAPNAGRIRAIDVAPRMIEIAQEKARSAGVDNVTFEVAAIDTLDLMPGTFDMVMAHSILHLVEDRDEVVRKVHGWLKPVGLFVSSTMCLEDVAPWLPYAAPFARAVGFFPRTIRYFSADDLVTGIEAAGFAVEHRWQPNPKDATFLIARRR